VFKLMQLRPGSLDVFVSHEWPTDIARFGDLRRLLRVKPFFRADIESGKLGSVALQQLLVALRPKHWFSAHLHVRFEALVQHPDATSTRFLALDKVLPRGGYLELVHVESPAEQPLVLEYDPEWLCVLRATLPFFPLGRGAPMVPPRGPRLSYAPTPEDLQWVAEHVPDLRVPQNFSITAPPFVGGHPRRTSGQNEGGACVRACVCVCAARTEEGMCARACSRQSAADRPARSHRVCRAVPAGRAVGGSMARARLSAGPLLARGGGRARCCRGIAAAPRRCRCDRPGRPRGR
jgi:hypothetical protein